ncbi:hypothetical protein [Natrialba taiwanensis]|uniref:Uncharacterized protein n=1 Tax=Natrialba taiwanensis DSM 12281 TaxID=1230458 RepID=M0A8Q5_9EURY|nr:hypothetical protein [Natrialba taiwanensis]ELY94751.1 hypothetical protein C484_05362 [Natrialba taiwanensis DSM 12281]
MARDREACGRCSTSIVVDAAQGDQHDGERGDRDPYGDARIEVDDAQLRRFSPDGWVTRVASELDAVMRRFTWGE